MSPVVMAILVLSLYVVFYRFYARGVLAKRVFMLSDELPTPAHTLRDDVDYLPSNKYVLFGHHYASIAGLAPMLGPAIAVIWGWLPALCWVVLGTLLVGAVHDFSALVLSVRHQGQSMGTIARDVISPRTRLLFLLVIFFLVALAMGVFVLVISGLFAAPDAAHIPATAHPEAVFPTYALMLIAMLIGFLIYRRNMPLWPLIGVGFVLMLLTTWMGLYLPVTGISASTWSWSLLVYAFAASVLPVWLLLQPRDFLNSLLLYLAMACMLAGFFVMSPEWAAPMINAHPEGAPPMMPFLFIVIACGAISGFHGMVASGTTAKQLDKETDATFVGYVGMIGESLLALLAVLATTAGAFTSHEQWASFYGSWEKAAGLHQKLGVFIQGNGQFIHQLGIPLDMAMAFISVVVVAFAMTSVDTGTRLLRFNIEEIGHTLGLKLLGNRYVATLLAVAAIGFFAFFRVDGKPAGLFLWTLFGTTNQILAALTLLTVTIYLYRKRRPVLYTLLPMLLVLAATVSGMVMGIIEAVGKDHWTVAVVGGLILLLALWVLFEALVVAMRIRADHQSADRQITQGESP
ncbi:MAG: carbon starvation protein A [Zetaproteobacteria bacterium CG12_big_fil_rev_8_21_14_0_65_55_1124]|nr:MAG: carbon starvation protein A [Zetaproteobacteria bacterium CG1_02_55_237]PIS18345.1 MAG: carbon starvation protein A [Zetaproteobacteria bacterium CG08_land_8_20_14_0_20_55_17]PIW43062.1 MAG: carbon starvation protein A [Zetaproteobacteria bacterium CG12_big_fil_rev_8_21_14_0_65_55_1124]PIY52285.1 MAG: carbon starvation protein A [Zetaproteobacteria bacterium CG_4_10_14_0_8_um_filter_55_43]PIZ38777.1 MAG: carbon starvation protein A [Zetaproteobacteria bacterium CG_4_10_14_0_2_um_filter_